LKVILRISAPHFTAGIVVGVRAAPIIAYMKDWDAMKIITYCQRKGWDVEIL
jgi:hypothetical protein